MRACPSPLQHTRHAVPTAVCCFGVAAALCALVGFSTALAATHVPSKSRPMSLPPVISSVNSVHSTQARSLHLNGGAEEDLLRLARDARQSSVPLKGAPNACSGDAQTVCYDYRRGRSVIPATKAMQPDVPGMKREGVSLKRDRLAFNYSF
jgi:hypothetical protein